MEFIGYTIGLECNHKAAKAGDSRIGKMVMVEKTRRADGAAELQAVSGRNLTEYRDCTAVVSAADFEGRPHDPYDNTKEAIWALDLCGFVPMALDK